MMLQFNAKKEFQFRFSWLFTGIFNIVKISSFLKDKIDVNHLAICKYLHNRLEMRAVSSGEFVSCSLLGTI